MKTPSIVNVLALEATCVGIGIRKHEEFMRGATRADKRKIDRLVKIHLPDLYEDLMLSTYNPYVYYKTKRHLILVHSSIEYFINYE